MHYIYVDIFLLKIFKLNYKKSVRILNKNYKNKFVKDFYILF